MVSTLYYKKYIFCGQSVKLIITLPSSIVYVNSFLKNNFQGNLLNYTMWKYMAITKG